VEARFLPLLAARFLVEATLVFLLAAFLVLFLPPREVVDFFEADRPLLDFFPADLLRAFVVGILSSVTPVSTFDCLTGRAAPLYCTIGWIPERMRWADEPAVFATKQRPFIAEEALPVVDYALVFPPGLLEKTCEVGDLPLFPTDAKLA